MHRDRALYNVHIMSLKKLVSKQKMMNRVLVAVAPAADPSGVPHDELDGDDAFCRVVRVQLGHAQIEALAGAVGTAGRRARRAAIEHALLASAWSVARPGEPAALWRRVVQPIEPAMDDVAPDEQLLVLVAGVRRAVAEAAEAGDEEAKARMAYARETVGEPGREQIGRLLARARDATA